MLADFATIGGARCFFGSDCGPRMIFGYPADGGTGEVAVRHCHIERRHGGRALAKNLREEFLIDCLDRLIAVKFDKIIL